MGDKRWEYLIFIKTPPFTSKYLQLLTLNKIIPVITLFTFSEKVLKSLIPNFDYLN